MYDYVYYSIPHRVLYKFAVTFFRMLVIETL